MTTNISSLEPKSLWGHFEELLKVPRPSQHEGQAIAHLKRWAQDRKYSAEMDATGNLVVRVPATKGHEKAHPVILQGHVDMVAEKDKATEFDFLKDPILARVDGDWVVAEHTTLGADNGMGVATAQASADDPAVVHGPLELLFTIDEETALTGASGLDGKLLKGRTLLNLDSEEDGTLFVGCAGGCNTETTLDLERAPLPKGYAAVLVEVGGLKGGHSGLLIHENRGNSIKVLARVLKALAEKHDVLVGTIEGGNKHNAIPREASAIVGIPTNAVGAAQDLAAAIVRMELTERGTIDGELKITVAAAKEAPRAVASPACTRRLVDLLLGLPNGVVTMSRDIPGLVETSTNLGVIHTEGDKVRITSCSRSSVAPALSSLLDQIAATVRLAGGGSSEVGGYPGWQPDMTSGLLRAARDTYRRLRVKEPKVTAIHAGLECGIIGEKLGGKVEMISYGPELQGVHAPGERVNVPSVARFWEFHKALLAALA
jgi:dipeptidase D